MCDVENTPRSFEITSVTPKSRQKSRYSRNSRDDDLWKFLIDNIPTNYSQKQIFESFIAKTYSKYYKTYDAFLQRFRTFLAPKLPFEDFDIETKLALFARYRIAIPADYVAELKKHADFEIDCNKYIIDYKIKMKNTLKEVKVEQLSPAASAPRMVTPKRESPCSFECASASVVNTVETPRGRRNPRKMDSLRGSRTPEVSTAVATPLRNPEFTSAPQPFKGRKSPAAAILTPVTTPTSGGKVPVPFTREEDQLLWTYFINYIGTSHSIEDVIVEYSRETGMVRSPFLLRTRFVNILAPSLHLTAFSIEIKLKLYKRYRIPVDRIYLKKLREQAEVELIVGSFIVSSFTMKRSFESVTPSRRQSAVPSTLSFTPSTPNVRRAPLWFPPKYNMQSSKAGTALNRKREIDSLNVYESPFKRTPSKGNMVMRWTETTKKTEDDPPKTPKTWTVSSPAMTNLIKELTVGGSPDKIQNPRMLKQLMMNLKDQITTMNMPEIAGLKECIDVEIQNLADK